MPSSIEQRIATLSGNLNGPKDICIALARKHVEYLDLLERYNVTGKNIYILWIRCGRNNDNLMYLLEAYRNGHAESSEVLQKSASECRTLIAKGQNIPRSQRLT